MVTSTTTLPAVAFMRMSSTSTDVNSRAMPCRNDVSLKVSSVPATVTVKDTCCWNATGVDDELAATNRIADVASRAAPSTKPIAIPQIVLFETLDSGGALASMGASSDLYSVLRCGPLTVNATVTVDILLSNNTPVLDLAYYIPQQHPHHSSLLSRTEPDPVGPKQGQLAAALPPAPPVPFCVAALPPAFHA